MELKDKRDIAAPRQEVWNALLDPEVLKDCIPGCQDLTGNPDDGFEATVVQKVGPVKATFKGQVTITDREEPKLCTITGEGKGGPAGFAKGGAKVELHETGGVTTLHYDVEAKVGGKLAQLGGRVVDSFAKKMADQFFENFDRRVSGDMGSDEMPTPAANAAEDPSVNSSPVDASEMEGMASTGAAENPPESRDPSTAEPTDPTKKKGLMGRIFGS